MQVPIFRISYFLKELALLDRHFAFERDDDFHLIAHAAVRHSQNHSIMKSIGIHLFQYDITQNRLLQELMRHLTLEILLAEVTAENPAGPPVDVHVHDVVVIDIIHFHAIIIV